MLGLDSSGVWGGRYAINKIGMRGSDRIAKLHSSCAFGTLSVALNGQGAWSKNSFKDSIQHFRFYVPLFPLNLMYTAVQSPTVVTFFPGLIVFVLTKFFTWVLSDPADSKEMILYRFPALSRFPVVSIWATIEQQMLSDHCDIWFGMSLTPIHVMITLLQALCNSVRRF